MDCVINTETCLAEITVSDGSRSMVFGMELAMLQALSVGLVSATSILLQAIHDRDHRTPKPPP